MQDYVFTIPNQKLKTYRLFAWIILVVNAILFALVIASGPGSVSLSAAVAGIIIPFLGILVAERFLKKQAGPFPIPGAMLVMAAAWLIIHNYMAMICLLLLAGLYIIASRRMQISINDAYITYPSFPPRRMEWHTLDQVILKDGLLTIDLKNNTLIQQAVPEINSVNEREFNEFCREQLKKSAAY